MMVNHGNHGNLGLPTAMDMPEDWFEAIQNEDDTIIHDSWLVLDADYTTR